MKQIYIFTLGFTPEFVLKPLFEAGVSEDVYIIILYTLVGDEYSKKRVRDAISYIEKLSREGGFIDRVFFQQVSLGNTFYDLVYEVALALTKMLRDAEIRRGDIEGVDVWLTGGMRIMVTATLVACKMLFEYMKIPVTFHVWSEDGTYKYTFDLQLLDTNLREVSKARMEILKKIVSLGKCTYEELVNTKQKESTIRKLVEFLRKDNLVYCKRIGRRTICKATDLGTLIIKIIELAEVIP